MAAEASSSAKGPYMKAGWENQPFPVGGGRVPEGMKDHQNWMDLPEVPVVQVKAEDISEKYAALETKRNAFGELKKQLALLTPTVASIYKNSATESNVPETNTDKLQLIANLKAQEAKRRDELVAHLRGFQQKDGLKPTDGQFGADLEKVLSTVPASDCFVQTEHTAWNDLTKRLSQNLFREQNVFLQQMKEEKKRALAAKKD